LLAVLEHLRQTASADRVVQLATQIEDLTHYLGRPRALAQAEKVRVEAMRKLGEWSHTRSLAEQKTIDRFLDAGRHTEAVAAARTLLARAEAAGEDAYAEAAYDLAICHWLLGRCLRLGGAAEAALAPLAEARNRFQRLADDGDSVAAGMASKTITVRADCLRALGRLDEAAQAYEEAIAKARERNDPRSVAVGSGQLGAVRMLQGNYDEALTKYTEARKIVEDLGEPGSVAVVWHQIGVTYRYAGQYAAAEQAYQESLKIEVQRGNRSGEATTLTELGSLYHLMDRWENAVEFYRQAAVIHTELGDLGMEGRSRSNAGNSLIKLQRYDEARRELLRAIECDKQFGHAAEPWKAFAILGNLERAVGNTVAAEVARQRAIQAYLAYRRDGGENLSGGGRLIAMIAEAIRTGQIDDAAEGLSQLSQRPNLPDYVKPLIPALQAVLRGSRDPALVADPNLDYDDAAELLFLLESLASS
jgi:tetratricopeptide (TPR) repeat protein